MRQEKDFKTSIYGICRLKAGLVKKIRKYKRSIVITTQFYHAKYISAYCSISRTVFLLMYVVWICVARKKICNFVIPNLKKNVNPERLYVWMCVARNICNFITPRLNRFATVASLSFTLVYPQPNIFPSLYTHALQHSPFRFVSLFPLLPFSSDSFLDFSTGFLFTFLSAFPVLLVQLQPPFWLFHLAFFFSFLFVSFINLFLFMSLRSISLLWNFSSPLRS